MFKFIAKKHLAFFFCSHGVYHQVKYWAFNLSSPNAYVA